MRIIALTGGIGSGKSTVAELFAELGVPIIDADVIAREQVEPRQPALTEIVNVFGNSILNADGTLNRRALRDIIFADDQARLTLEAILHPRIRQRMQALAAQQTAPYGLFVIPLLIETGQAPSYEQILVVDCDDDLRRRRVMQRDHQPAESVDAIFARQATREQRLAIASEVIHNSGDIEQLRTQVNALHRRYTQQSL